MFNTGTKYLINISLNKERRVEFGCSRWIKSDMAGKAWQQEHDGHTASVVIMTDRQREREVSTLLAFPQPTFWVGFLWGVS